MARIFEAARTSEASLAAPVKTVPAAEPRPVSRPAPAAVETPVEVPFIEVGGATIEGSPDVLAVEVRGPASFLSPPTLPIQEPARPEIAFEAVPDGLTEVDPENRLAGELVAYHDPGHPIARQYENLLDHVTSAAAAPAALLLCGAAEGAGTTTATLNLAITLAARGARVAVVDACVARPAVAQRLGMAPMPGLSEVCTGQVPLSRALRDAGLPNLTVLTAGEEPCRPSLAMRSFPGVLVQLKRHFEQIFVDGPAWHEGPEMTALAASCEALFLVAPHGSYDNADFKRLLRRLPRQGVRLAGCVVTRRS